jgi:hypothetical protein
VSYQELFIVGTLTNSKCELSEFLERTKIEESSLFQTLTKQRLAKTLKLFSLMCSLFSSFQRASQCKEKGKPWQAFSYSCKPLKLGLQGVCVCGIKCVCLRERERGRGRGVRRTEREQKRLNGPLLDFTFLLSLSLSLSPEVERCLPLAISFLHTECI